MSRVQDPHAGAAPQRSGRRGLLPPEIADMMVAPAKVGAWSGTAGALAGVAGAIGRDTNVVASGIVSGAQWFALGGTFWFARSITARSMGGEDRMSSSDKIQASAVGGSAAGAMAGLIRGPARILPAMAVWGVLGATGQLVANRLSRREPKAKKNEDDSSWLRSRWSPLKKLTDDEYIKLMEDKIFKVDVDIALIDDRIAELRATDQQGKKNG
ncbi:hypothetical protein ESCO_004650 [Escovopsis weberi]|uniref:Uncharacterized protein n=1 Tax=Escovopsis weberi TaxID=150374 RepID=A0A0M9VRM7_ESCWE|nr:hypothetical protein ESCO_004650 [Escovopsis weberi]